MYKGLGGLSAAVEENRYQHHYFYYLVDCRKNNRARAMIWSDYARHRSDEFVEKCPKFVVQCVWYCFDQFGDNLEEMYGIRLRPLDIFERYGYDQLPTGRN